MLQEHVNDGKEEEVIGGDKHRLCKATDDALLCDYSVIIIFCLLYYINHGDSICGSTNRRKVDESKGKMFRCSEERSFY